MANGDTQFPALPDRQVAIFSAREAYHDSTEEIQRKLLSLALQQAEIQTRIRILRHAVSALIQAFGPASLCGDQPLVCEASHLVTCGQPPMIDLCRTILRESKQWLTFGQIRDAMRIKYPFSMDRFLQPGTAVSNALRTLLRHGAVETKLNLGIREWRLVSEQAGTVSEWHGSGRRSTDRPNALPRIPTLTGI